MWGTRATGPLTIPAFLPPDWPTRGSSLPNLEPGPLPTQAAALTTGPSHGLLQGPASPGVGLSHPHLPSVHRHGHFDFPVHSKVPVLPAHPPTAADLPLSLGSIPQPPLFSCTSKDLHCTPSAPCCHCPVRASHTPITAPSLNEPFPSYRLGICTPSTSSLTSPWHSPRGAGRQGLSLGRGLGWEPLS